MISRKPVFPNVIEINVQAGQRLGCNVYLVYDANEWILIDIGFEESVDEIVDLIRGLDFPLSACKTIVATHADVDHVQGLAKLKQALRTSVTAHTTVPAKAGTHLSSRRARPVALGRETTASREDAKVAVSGCVGRASRVGSRAPSAPARARP